MLGEKLYDIVGKVTGQRVTAGAAPGAEMVETSFQGSSIYYTTQSQRLSRLNGTAVVFEWNVDEHGNGGGTTWEWK